MKRVNEKGMAAIKHWIEATRGEDDFGPLAETDARALEAWADEAERSMDRGNPQAMVEMSQHMSRSGRPETFTLGEDMVTENCAILIDFDGTETRGVFRIYPANEETEDALSDVDLLACVSVDPEFWYGTGASEDLDFETKREAQDAVELLARKVSRAAGITWQTNY
jgi:hypothetical protein